MPCVPARALDEVGLRAPPCAYPVHSRRIPKIPVSSHNFAHAAQSSAIVIRRMRESELSDVGGLGRRRFNSRFRSQAVRVSVSRNG